MTVVEIINMASMVNSRVATVRAVLVGMVGMMFLATFSHEVRPFAGFESHDLRVIKSVSVSTAIESLAGKVSLRASSSIASRCAALARDLSRGWRLWDLLP